MSKFFTVLKREYLQRVRAKMFIVSTIVLPLVMALFGIIPVLIVSIPTGAPMRIVVVDQTGKVYDHLKQAQSNELRQNANENANPARGPQQRGFGNFVLEQAKLENQSNEQIRANLEQRLDAREIEGYVILSPDFLDHGRAEFFNRNPGDLFSGRRLQQMLNQAVREQRLIEAKVDQTTRQRLSEPVQLQAIKVGDGRVERDSGERFALVFVVGFVMYLTILMYGQVVLGAVIEEKETRIAEILFSSVKPFTLMMGKLVGVSLVALTQFAIWGAVFSAFAAYGVNILASRGFSANLPSVPFSHYIYFALFFLLGYFIYATIYALVGSMVTTAQEGGQLAMPIILILVVSFYLFLPVSRSPDSNFSFWVSMLPFSAPVAMVVRILAQTPPFWQIALSLIIGFSTVLLIMWMASRIYRVGMLMYGKRASIAEAVRWARQA